MSLQDHNRQAYGSNHNLSVIQSQPGTTTFEVIADLSNVLKGPGIIDSDLTQNFIHPRVITHSQDMQIMYH